MALIIREINNSDDLIKIFKLRIEVFTFEQNCPIEEEFDFTIILILSLLNLLLKKIVSALELQESLITK